VILHQIHGADEHIAEEGIIVERIIGRTEAGDPIVEEDENPAFLLKSRAMKDLIRTLKEFGCLDDPDSKQAEAVQDTADALRSFMEAADQ
jgi:phage terminase small subunit